MLLVNAGFLNITAFCVCILAMMEIFSAHDVSLLHREKVRFVHDFAGEGAIDGLKQAQVSLATGGHNHIARAAQLR